MKIVRTPETGYVSIGWWIFEAFKYICDPPEFSLGVTIGTRPYFHLGIGIYRWVFGLQITY